MELDKTWRRVFRVWWLLIWRCLVFGSIAGGVGGSVFAVIAVLLGWRDQSSLRIAGGIGGYLAGLPVSLLIVRAAVRKRYEDFRIALVPLTHEPDM